MVRHRAVLIAAVMSPALLQCGRATAQNDGLTPRERRLERLVRELTARVDELEKRLDERDGTKTTTSPSKNLSSRVDKLEQTVDTMKQSASPAIDAKDWAKVRQVVDRFSQSDTMRAYWKEGLRLESADESFKLKIGGRIHFDWAFFGAGNRIERRVGSLDDGTEFRRARLYTSGTIYDNIGYKAQFDFAGGESEFKDVYMAVKNVPVVGNVRIGHFKEPFSLEELTSSNYITFMETSLVTTFAPGRNAGFMIHDHLAGERMTWAAGFFREVDNFGRGSDGRDYNATARLTGLPWYAEDGRKLLHVGVGYTHKNFEDDTVRFRARPEAHQAPRFADTRDFSAEYADIVDAELALVYGPFSLQGEYAQAFVERRAASDPAFWAASLQASYFLTGEHRPYKRSSGTFGRVKPKRPFGKEGGSGAWEIAARYSHLDLSDAGVKGGELRDFTFGLNWYLNPNMRIMWNYIRADLTGDDGNANVFQMRFQLNF